ncbi:MAG: DUF6268 family outer membrane beta-barrel protein [Planctomycetota bacterium]
MVRRINELLIAASLLCATAVTAAEDAAPWLTPVDASAGYAERRVSPVFAPPPGGVEFTQHAVEQNDAPVIPPTGRRPPGARRAGVFQGARSTYEYLPGFDNDSFGHQAWLASVDFGTPPLVLKAPLLISPGYGVHLFDGPAGLDVPATVHDLQLSFATFRPLTDRWLFRGNVIVGLYGDEHSLDDADAVQVTGFAMGIYNASPQWQWAVGAGYVNNADLSVIPVVGVINDRGWIKYEAMMPRPRIVVPLDQTPGRESSVYLSGEFGGGVWAVRRPSGVTEPLQLSRYAVLLGYERKAPGGAWRYELGYVFGRELEYQDSGDTLDVDDSLVARIGWKF